MTDEKLFEAIEIFKDLKIEYCLFASTLLSIIRDGMVWEFDREVDVLIDCHDLDEIEGHPLANRFLEAVGGFGNINMRDDTIAVTGIILKDDYAVLNYTDDRFFVYDKGTILPFKRMRYKGRMISVPNKPTKFLSEYFGRWKIDQPTWRWADAPGIIHADSVDEAIRKHKEKK